MGKGGHFCEFLGGFFITLPPLLHLLWKGSINTGGC